MAKRDRARGVARTPQEARRRRQAVAAVFGWAASVAVAGVFLAPLIWMTLAALQPEERIFTAGLAGMLSPAGWTLSNFADAWRRGALGFGLVNSAVQVALIVGVGLVLNSMAAFAFARLEFPGRDLLFGFVVVLIILPVEALAVPLFLTARDLGLIGGRPETLAALTLPFAVKAFNVYFLRQHFLSLPRALEEAAIVDGAGAFRIYWSIALPSVRPALATVVVLDTLTHWGDFIWPLMVCREESTRTIQISMANLFTQPPVQWGDILAAALIATAPVILLFATCQRYIVSTEFQSGVK